MISNDVMTDDKTAVDRWENEGGRTSPSAAFNPSLRPTSFRVICVQLRPSNVLS